MANNKIVRFGPVALTATTTTNILNPGTTTGGVGMPSGSGNLYFLIKHITIVNKTTSAHTFTLYIGATGGNAAGTEVIGTNVTVPPNSYIERWGNWRLDAADFLVGGADAITSLTFQAEGEIGVAG